MGTVIFAVFLELGGLGLLYLGVMGIRGQRKLARDGRRVQGAIVEVTARESEGEMTRYIPIFEFKGADEVVHRVTGDGSPRKRAYRVGQAIEVIHLAGEEEKATIHSFVEMWGLAVLLLVMGVLMVVGGVVFLRGGDQPNADSWAQPVRSVFILDGNAGCSGG